MPNLTPRELLTTTRSVRKRLDFTRPVPMDLIRDCIEIATQAPSGSNAQTWHFVIVTDPGRKQAIAELYRKGWRKYSGKTAGARQEEEAASRPERVMSSADYLALHLQDVPVWLIPCINGRVEQSHAWMRAGQYASIIPAAWSFMLAARMNGLATCWTSLHLMYEEKAAEILGIPYAEVMQVALIPVAYPIGEDFKPAERKSLDGVLHIDQW